MITVDTLLMDNVHKASMEELDWKAVRKTFLSVNPALGKIIDDLDPGPSFTFFKLSYPFGSEILKNGVLQLPNKKGELVSFYNGQINPEIREKLGYNYGSNPVTMTVKNSLELFMQLRQRIIPLYGAVPPGKIFGLWNVLSAEAENNLVLNSNMWGLTAGARSLFMLPKISKAASHQKLQQKIGLCADKPKCHLDHWEIFREIEQRMPDENPWNAELLFFSKKWFEFQQDPHWLKFNYWLAKKAWSGSEYFRSEFIWDMVFSAIQETKNIRPEPYFTNTVRHLFAIGNSALPGFAPATNDDAAPIQKIQNVYQEIYNLDYTPTIMQPTLFSTCMPNKPVYYSLQFPTTISAPIKNKNMANKIINLQQIHHILEKIRSEILQGKLNLEHTTYYKLLQKVKYDFFHSDPKERANLLPSKQMPIEDPLLLTSCDNRNNLPFPEDCPFVRGCIRISLKQQKPLNK